MPYSFAGIAVFPVGVEEYNISIALVSDTNRAILDSKSSSSPCKIASLSETIGSLLSTTSPTTIEGYIISVPPAFPADRYYNVFEAVESAKLIDEDVRPAPSLNHGETYAVRLPRKETTLLAVDLTSSNHLYATRLSSSGGKRWRSSTVTHELSVAFADNNSLQRALDRFLTVSVGARNFPEQIVVIKPTSTPTKAGAVDIKALLANTCPDVPVSIVTPNEIAEAAASLAYVTSFMPKRLIRITIRDTPFPPVPLSVATSSGAVVPIFKTVRERPNEFFVILTNSVENQKSVTVRLLAGHHKLAKNNIRRAVVVLDGLNPLPKGDARIKVLIRVVDSYSEWRKTAQVVLEQKDGPQKKFIFPLLLERIPGDAEERYSLEVKGEDEDYEEYWLDSEPEVVGKLPE